MANKNSYIHFEITFLLTNSLVIMETLVRPNYVVLFFFENYSAVHLINSGTFIDLFSLFLK